MDRIVPLSASARSQSRAETQLQAELANVETSSLRLETVAGQVVAACRYGIILLDREGIVLDANPAALKMLGKSLPAVQNRPLLDLVQLPTAPFGPEGGLKAIEYMMLGVVSGDDGSSLPVEIAVMPLSHAGQDLFMAQLRISAQSELDDELQRLAYFDPITQLPNRYATLRRLREMMTAGSSFTVWHLNIDRFRVLKNSLGHGFGDRVLVAMGERLSQLFDDGSWISRLGNDEFILILSSMTRHEVDKICVRIQAALTRELMIDGRDIHMKASLGVVDSSQAYDDPAQLLSDAEIASFQAKIGGGGTFAVFDQTMREVLVNLQRTESDLRAAVKDDKQLWVAYQPIVDLRSGLLAGFEALVRWEHPEYGQIPPNEFIPIAEATGLIIPLGRDVLIQACRDAQRWSELVGSDHMPFISVNLSLRQLAEGDFIEEAKELIATTNMDPSRLKLEITESTLMTDPEQSIARLQEIRKLGVQLSIDDFGTGYSSLAYLHRLPVNTLKIDRSFVSRINDPNDREIVRIITELAGILKLDVIAEGVETIAHVKALQSIGCDYGQGFFLGKPLDPEEAERLIVDQQHWAIA